MLLFEETAREARKNFFRVSRAKRAKKFFVGGVNVESWGGVNALQGGGRTPAVGGGKL